MSSSASVSIILCTHNRALSLRRTLEALGRLCVPSGWIVEVLVMDNASTDDTAATVRHVDLAPVKVRYVYEGRQGKSHALNTAVALAQGEFFLFTDDDVIPAPDWLEQMVTPMLNGNCDVVNGRLVLAPHLQRPWQTPMHLMWMALSLEIQSRDWSHEIIGASKGFRRSVLERVPAWDTELGSGPGALGFCEDTLFGRQLAEAGFRITFIPQATAVHQMDAARLRRSAWLSDARKRGRTQAYLRYHWEHADLRLPHLKWPWHWAKLNLRRKIQPPPEPESEGCPAWEMSYVSEIEMYRQYCIERRRPRNYEQRGLVKLSALAPAPPP